MDELHWEDRPRYYAALDAVRREGEDLTGWLEYTAEGLLATLEKVWARVHRLAAESGRKKLVLRPKQEQLLQFLRDRKSMTPQELWDALGVTRQGALKLIQPLLEAGLIQRVGTRKSSRYLLT
jgi:Fic family protein